MAEILHQLIGILSQKFQGVNRLRWCRISAINSKTLPLPTRVFLFRISFPTIHWNSTFVSILHLKYLGLIVILSPRVFRVLSLDTLEIRWFLESATNQLKKLPYLGCCGTTLGRCQQPEDSQRMPQMVGYPMERQDIWANYDRLVVEPTHLKHILVKLGSSSPIFGLPPPRWYFTGRFGRISLFQIWNKVRWCNTLLRTSPYSPKGTRRSRWFSQLPTFRG